jgi:hypothetical protein
VAAGAARPWKESLVAAVGGFVAPLASGLEAWVYVDGLRHDPDMLTSYWSALFHQPHGIAWPRSKFLPVPERTIAQKLPGRDFKL